MAPSYDSSDASKYSKRDFNSTDFLAFRNLPALLGTNNENLTALDYGCGTGRSTRFLNRIGYRTVGVDINHNMLLNAAEKDPSGLYIKIKSSMCPFSDNSMDLVLCSFVLLEIQSLIDIHNILVEIRRLLKPSGRAVIIVNTEIFYKGKWVNCYVDFPENSGTLSSGQKVRVKLVPEDILLTDYFWTDEDYKRLFEFAGLKLVGELRPLGNPEDNIVWMDESKTAPYVVYILKK